MTSQQKKSKKSTSGYRRTPNAACVICGKPLYRRPFELKKVRHVACMKHRAEAQKLSGITEKQQAALSLGREKGTNHRAGYKHKQSSRRKIAKAVKTWCAENPDKALARGVRGEKHYKWKGGSTRLNTSIRRMNENRKWMDAIKARDKKCLACGSTERLESHHIVELAILISENKVKNREDARNCPALWDLSNGQTLCEDCHYKVHGRRHAD